MSQQAGQQRAVDAPVDEAAQVLAGVGLLLENEHEQQRQLARRLRYRAAGIAGLEPGVAAAVDAQLVAERAEHAFVLRRLALQFGPQHRLAQAVDVASGVEHGKQFLEAGQLFERDRGVGWVRFHAASMACG